MPDAIRGAAAAALLALSAGSAWSQSARLVVSLNEANAGSDSGFPVRVGSDLIVVADDGRVGSELWIVRADSGDGRPPGSAGFELLRDVNPGPEHGALALLGVSAVGAFFTGTTVEHGTELWLTDGTLEGTREVADIQPGPGSSSPSRLVASGDEVVFRASTEQHGTELWASDGTAQGTRLLVDARPGPESSYPDHAMIVGRSVYFLAHADGSGEAFWRADLDGGAPELLAQSGDRQSAPKVEPAGDGILFSLGRDGLTTEWWVSDGTVAGTVRLEVDGVPLTTGTEPQAVAFGDRTLFGAGDGSRGRELWVTRGQPETTELVLDIDDGAADSDPGSFFTWKDQVLFAATTSGHGRELWASDGTAGGTLEIRDLYAGETDSSPSRFTALGERCIFAARDPSGVEPWVTDGTSTGTRRLFDINPGLSNSNPLQYPGAVRIGGLLFFYAYDRYHGQNVWRTDGTPVGTFRIDGSSASQVGTGWLAGFADRAVFEARGSESGNEPWWSDGSGSGATLLADIRLEPQGGSDPEPLLAHDDEVLIGLGDAPLGLWASDGSALGTRQLIAGDFDLELAELAGEVFVSGTFGRLDTVTGEIVEVRSSTGELISSANGLVSWGEAVYFLGFDESGRRRLWRSNGREEGTVPLADLSELDGLAAATYVYTAAASGLLFIAAFTDDWGAYLLRTDGTAAGTETLRYFPSDALFEDSLRWLVAVADRVVFVVLSEDVGSLWTSDGSVDGTRPVFEGLGEPYVSLRDLVAVGDSVFFLATDPVLGEELWRTDGSAAGTGMVRDITDEAGCSRDLWDRHGELVEHEGRLFFAGFRCLDGVELWTSDGTEAGTVLIDDLRVGSRGSFPEQLTSAAGSLLFSAHSEAKGREPWLSDGTAMGTNQVADIWPGPEPSSPRDFLGLGSQVYLSADDGSHGRELWVLDLPEPPELLVVELEPSGAGRVETVPAGIDCPGACESLFPLGTRIELEAVPEPGWLFQEWSGEPACASGVVDLTDETRCTAIFRQCDATELLELTDRTVTEDESHVTCGSIQIGPALRVAAAAELSLTAPKVVFEDGVELEFGARMTVGDRP